MKSVDIPSSALPSPCLPRVCLTGGIACGKSLVACFLNDFGVETIDADDIVHELIPDPAERKRLDAEVFADPTKRHALEAKIHPVVKERIEKFLEGSESLEGLGCLGCLEGLEGLGGLESLDRNCAGRGSGHTFLKSSHPLPPQKNLPNHPNLPNLPNFRLPIIPLLFEAHWEKNFDIICCVVSERETQISRMMTMRGYTRAEAEARLAAQMPVAEKAAKSHYVIHNDGTPEELKEKVKKFLTWVSEFT